MSNHQVFCHFPKPIAPHCRILILRRQWLLMFSAVALLVTASSSALAAPITVPTSLNPGDPYLLAFLTSTRRDAQSPDISVYNTWVDDLAETVPELAALNQDWKVLASTASVNARDNTGTLPSFAGGSLGVPVFLLNDTKLADNYDDLWDGSIDNVFQVHETGDPFGGPFWRVWASTNSDGTASFLPLGTGSVNVTGAVLYTDHRWIYEDGNAEGDWTNRRFYAMSGVLTAVPEPSFVILMSFGAVMLIGARRYG